MRIRLQLVGSGTVADPFRAPMPVYSNASVDAAAGTITVDVPDGDAPADPPAAGSPDRPVIAGEPIVTRLPPAALARWRERLAERYRERADTYTPTPR